MKRKTFKIAATVCIGGILVFATARFCHHATQGFSLLKIASSTYSGQDLPTVERQIDGRFLEQLLQQKFHYLGRGLQSFAFVSEDGQFVIKLLNNRIQKKIELFSFLAYFPLLKNWAKQRFCYFKEKLQKTFQSYEIAFDEMQEKTALLYVHLLPTSDLPCKIKVVDRLNICHEIDLNEVGFLIQRRADLIYPTLDKWLKNQEIEKMKRGISSLIGLFFWKWEHRIADNDPLIRTNYGFIDQEAIQIDVGPLSKQNFTSDFFQKEATIKKITESLRGYLQQKAPDLIPFLDQELQKALLCVQ